MIKIIKIETIKPSSPTPIHLNNVNLSIMDQFSSADSYISRVLFFINGTIKNHQDTSNLLKTSLSQTLKTFYPLAGRVKNNKVIECNDLGVVFVEAAASNCDLHGFLENPEINDQKMLLKLIPERDQYTGILLLVQATYFGCGGLALGVCISHKIADANSLCTFLDCWSRATFAALWPRLVGDYSEIHPLFNTGTMFPPRDILPFSTSGIKLKDEKCVIKQFVFPASNIALLKAKSASKTVENPTRVEAVTSLIWKCGVKASRSSSSSSSRKRSNQINPTALVQAVNIRKRMVPITSKNTIGNLVGHSLSDGPEEQEGGRIELDSLVIQMREGIKAFNENYLKKVQKGDVFKACCESYKEMVSLLLKGDEDNLDLYIVSSWCRFPIYELDFGWGKPIWFGAIENPFKNVISLMDTKSGDGIEAWITLTQRNMIFFQHDLELLAYASLNPSIL